MSKRKSNETHGPAYLKDRIELPEKDRMVVTPGRSKIALDSGTTFENPFGSIIEIERVYFSKNKQIATITYHITKAFNTTRVRESLADFVADKVFHKYTGVSAMRFNHWTIRK